MVLSSNFGANQGDRYGPFALGGLWYSPILFARGWMREAGLDEQQVTQANMARVFGLSAIAALVMAFNLAAFIGPKATLGFALFAGFAAGLGWVAMSLGIVYLFEQRSLKLWLINSGYQVVAYTVMGGILGAWK
jgi:intracellular septation protein A